PRQQVASGGSSQSIDPDWPSGLCSAGATVPQAFQSKHLVLLVCFVAIDIVSSQTIQSASRESLHAFTAYFLCSSFVFPIFMAIPVNTPRVYLFSLFVLLKELCSSLLNQS